MGTDRLSILLVDDEDLVRNLTRSMLETRPYTVLTAVQAAEALQILLGKDRVDLLITDLSLTDLHGRELARKAREIRPGLRVLYLSGSPVEQPEDAPFLGKPFSTSALLAAVDAVMST